MDEAGHFIGGMWDWFDWRSLLVALTLIQGYVLIGSTYLILKTEGELQTSHYRTAKLAAWTTLLGAILITIATPVVYELEFGLKSERKAVSSNTDCRKVNESNQ
ncbi:MAG: cytochrome d ubiquinol oxidase subunit II [Nostoc sp.]